MALVSGQSLVRALKASSDPPVLAGPYKIDMATEAWANKSFYVANKEELIADWILTVLSKDKASIDS